jgi:hypothetical protein
MNYFLCFVVLVQYWLTSSLNAVFFQFLVFIWFGLTHVTFINSTNNKVNVIKINHKLVQWWLMLNLVGMSTIRSPTIAIGRGLGPLDVRTNSRTKLNWWSGGESQKSWHYKVESMSIYFDYFGLVTLFVSNIL